MKLKGGSQKLLLSKRWAIAGAVLAALATLTRFWHLNSVPPGLHPLEATLGLKAAATKLLPPLSDMQQLLSIWSVKLSGHFTHNPVTAVRFAAVKYGLLAMAFFFLWLRHLFGRRVAIFGTILAGVTPWALHLSRFGGGYSLALMFIAASLATLAWAWDKPTQTKIVIAFAITALGLYSDPVYNWYILGLLISLPAVIPGILRKGRKAKFSHLSIGFLVFLLMAAPASLAAIHYFATIGTHIPGNLAEQITDTLAMFIRQTPVNYDFNLATLPLLNVFAGLMLLLGLMATAVGLKSKANRQLAILFLVALLPAVLLPATATFADRTAALLWPTLALSALGMDYLLTQWLRTFPQNNAARQLGIFMLGILLILSARQGYNQYFLAWPASTETKQVYKAATIKAIDFAETEKFSGEKYLAGDEADVMIATYLKPANLILVSDLAIRTLQKATTERQFIITTGNKTKVLKALIDKQPGGKLKPQLDQNGQELFLVYTLKP